MIHREESSKPKLHNRQMAIGGNPIKTTSGKYNTPGKKWVAAFASKGGGRNVENDFGERKVNVFRAANDRGVRINSTITAMYKKRLSVGKERRTADQPVLR